MQVSSSSSDHIHQTYRTLAPLNWILRLVGLGYNLTERKNQNTCWLIAKNVLSASVLGIIDGYTLFYKIKYYTNTLSPSIRYTDYIQVVYDYAQYVVDLFYVRKYKNGNYGCFKQYETIDRIIGTVNYYKITKKLVKLMGFFGVLWTTSSICDFVAWVLIYGWLNAAVYTLTYIFLFIKILTTLDLTSQIMHIECRLRAFGDLMDTYCSATESCSPLFERNKNKWLETKEKVENQSQTKIKVGSSSPKRDSNVGYYELKWLSRCYLLLTEQAEFVNKMYGIRILLNSLSLLIDMVRFTNIAARILIGSQKTLYTSGYVPIASSIMRLLTCAAVLMSLVRHCEQVYKQRDRILDITYNLLIFKNPGQELKAATSELRDLIQARPINFTMANFFRLDYSLLVSIASVVVTYTIILLQAIN